MSKRKNLKNGSTNSTDLKEVAKIIDGARKKLKYNVTVGLDLIRASSKLDTIIKTSRK
jgi:hypothetical protein